MSMEYEIELAPAVDGHAVLIGLGAFTRHVSSSGAYEFGSGSFPPAHAHLREGVITFCVNGNSGNEVLRDLIRVLSRDGSVPRVTEL